MNEQEKQTVEKMIRIYCKHKHKPNGVLCDHCAQLLSYANLRLEKCTFGENKPTCEKCPVHCYKPVMRERIRQAMKYSGPRMIIYHPVLAVKHLLRKYRG